MTTLSALQAITALPLSRSPIHRALTTAVVRLPSARGYWRPPTPVRRIFLSTVQSPAASKTTCESTAAITRWVLSPGVSTIGVSHAAPSGDAGKWVQLTGTYDGTKWNLYDDGVLLGSTASTTGPVTSARNWRIGGSSDDPAWYFTGQNIDEVSIYNRALSADEVAAMASTGAYGGVVLQPNLASVPIPAADYDYGGEGEGYPHGHDQAIISPINGSQETTSPSATTTFLSRTPQILRPGINLTMSPIRECRRLVFLHRHIWLQSGGSDSNVPRRERGSIG